VELPACSAGAQSCFILAHLLPPQRTAGLRYISVADEVRGTELLQTDLTPAGTRLVADLCPGPCSSDLVPLAQVGRTLFLVGDDGLSGFEIYALEEGPQPALTRVTDLEPADWPANPIAGVAGSTFLIRSLDPEGGSSLLALDVTDDGAGGCVAGETSLCLGDGRFELTVDWRAFDGRTGVGHARPLTADTGTFWFFDEDNLELIVKVLDASAINGYYWVFYGALSNVEYELTVTDTETGESKRYRNPSGVFASNGDTTALPADAASPPPPLGPQPPSTVRAGTGATTGAACVAGATTLCLGDGRFELTVDWSDFSGGSGVGQAHPLTADTGSFWFFDEDNIELVIKVLDARAVNGRFWVFYGALSNVEYTITVTDTETGGVKTYRNELGSFGSGGDTEAF
jgi:ELWxxDGT repeat protein